MNTKFTITQFLNRFPNNDSCLDEIKKLRWGNDMTCSKCNRRSNFYKIKGRTAYACQFCGYHLYPLAGTIFDKSSTPLTLWFYAIYLMAQTRSGISAKQLQRELGVTYKTAWRMFKQIRILMAETGGSLLSGDVEIDETFVGGKGSNRATIPNFNEIPKEIVMGIVERGGKLHTKHIPNTGKWTLIEEIQKNVDRNASIMTDEYRGYAQLSKYGYRHFTVNHGNTQYTNGQIHTQNIENIWSQLKRGIFGVYRHVSKEYLQSYVNEYSWRYNNRQSGGQMFNLILAQVPAVKMMRTR